MKAIIFLLTYIVMLNLAFSQETAINSTGNKAHNSAMVDVSSTDKGMLIPRMNTAQRNAIFSPATGLLIFNTDCENFNFYSSSGWQPVNTGGGNVPASAGSITGSASVCAGQNGVSFSAGAVVNATAYSWMFTGTGFSIVSGAGTNSITANFSAGATAGVLTVYGTNPCGNGDASPDFSITVNPDVAASVSISANPSGAICFGTNVTFTATPVNGGASPSFQWKLNGSNVGANSSVYPNASLSNGDQVSCVITSNAACVTGSPATSNTVTMTVNYPPSSPTEGTHVATAYQIIWNWNSVSGATGYKWNSVNDYNSATDMLTATGKTETGLTCGKVYSRYVWAYNACGYSAATTLTDTTGANTANCGTLTDARDGKSYPTVMLGTQCWMAKNLNYGTYVTLATGQGGGGVQKYCAYDDTANCTLYGGLYEWDEMMAGASACNGTGESQPACSSPVHGICPDGWHIPSHFELVYFVRQLGSSPNSFPYDDSQNGHNWFGIDEGTNAKPGGCSGFNALFGGYTYYGAWVDIGTGGFFYTSSVYAPSGGYARWGFHVDTGNAQFDINDPDHNDGMSVRCVKD